MSLIRSIYHGSRPLFYTGSIHFLLGVVFLVLMGFDTRTVNLENVWLKPFRFAVSIFLFTWTYAWFTNFYQSNRKLVQVLNGIIAICMFIEIILIAMQAGRGVASHFNTSTAFDAAVYSVMGAAIGFNAFILGILFVLFAFFDKGGNSYRNAIIWGMFIFLWGNFAGYLLVRYGAPVITENITLTGWKPNMKDLRIPHAIGLHAIQILPVAMWIILKLHLNTRLIHVIGLLYLFIYFTTVCIAMS
jgi:hypothetical protein